MVTNGRTDGQTNAGQQPLPITIPQLCGKNNVKNCENKPKRYLRLFPLPADEVTKETHNVHSRVK